MAVNPYDMSPDPNDPSKDPTRVGYMGQLDLKSPINPQEAFNAQKAGRMPSIQQNQNPLLSAATTAINVYGLGKMGNAAYGKAAELLGQSAPTPAGGLAGAYPAAAAGTPVPLARPEGLGAAAPTSNAATSVAPSAGEAALAANASPTGLAAAKAAEGSITAGAQTASPALGELIGAGTAGEAGAAAGATELAALGEGAAGLGADLAGAGLVAGAGEGIADILPFFFLKTGGRVGKAKGGGLTAKKQIINTEDPKFHAMKVAFDNLVRKYDNPLLAAVAMHSGTQVVDSAIRQAAHTGKEISDFLPKSAVLYMYLLSQAALGAHSKLKDRTARKSGGRTGYARNGYVSPSDAEGTTDTLSTPEQTGDQNVQLASASTDYRDYLIGKGYSPAAASGIIGNAYHESGGLNPTIKGDSGNSFGLFQFNQQGEQPAFRKWVADNKRDATDPYAQLDFVDQRLRNNYSDTFDKLQNAKDPSEAAKHFMLGYERPKEGPTQQLNARMQYANKIAAGEDLPTNTKDYGDQAPATGGGLNAKKGPFEKIADTVGIPDVVPKESSFWVPLIAGLGGMLASNQYRFSQRLGEGLLAGAGAYGSQQDREFKQQQLAQTANLAQQRIDIEKQNNALAMFGKLYQPQYNADGKLEYLNVRTGEPETPEEATKKFFGSLYTEQPVKSAVDIAKNKTTGTTQPQGGAGSATAPSGTETAQPAAPATTSAAPAGSVSTQPKPVVLKPEEFKTPEDVDTWARSQDRVVQMQQKADEQTMLVKKYQDQLDRLPSNPLTATRRAELTTLLSTSRALEQSYRQNADTQAKELAAPYKTQLEKKFGVSQEMIEAEAKKAAEIERAKKQTEQEFATVVDAQGNEWRPAGKSEVPVELAPQPNTNASRPTVKASIDTETGRVNNVIPDAPSNGGYPTPTPPRSGLVLSKPSTSSINLRQEDEGFQKEFPGKLGNSVEAETRFKSLGQAFKLFSSDVLAEKRQGAALLARAVGAPEDFVTNVANGDPAAMQWVEKEGLNSVLNTLKAATNRFGQQEFLQMEKKGVPTISNDPHANFALVGELLGQSQWNKQFYLDWQKAQEKGWGSPSAFYSEWVQANPPQTYIASAMKQLGNFRGMSLPSNPKSYVEGAIYVAPDKFKSKALEQHLGSFGIKPGQLFRYNKETDLRPISREENFSAHLDQGNQ